MPNNLLHKPIFFWAHSTFWVAILGMAMASIIGCAGQAQHNQHREDQAGEYSSPLAAPETMTNSSLSVKGGDGQHPKAQSPSVVRFERSGRKHILSIPIQAQTHITPTYNPKNLTLAFDGPIPELKIPSTIPGELISSVKARKNAQGIHRLEVLCNREVQFLVTRAQPNLAEVHVSPAKTISSLNQDQQADPSPELESIDFQENDDGDLILELTATQPFDYRLQSGKDNELRLVLPQTSIPPHLVKLYRLPRFQTAVRSVLLTNTQKGALVVLAGAQEPVPVNRTGRTMYLRIPAQKPDSMPPESATRTTPDTQDQGPVSSSRDDRFDNRQIRLYPGMKKEYSGSPISLNLQDAEIEHVLRLIAEVGEYNLILDEDVSGTVSLKLEKVPWDQALDLVLLQKGLGMVQRGNILRIAPASTLEEEQQRIIEARKTAMQARQSEQDVAPLRTEYIQINYTKAADLQSNLQKFVSERGKLGYDAKTNQLIVSDTQKAIERIRNVVRKLDRAERQVLIEARLVYATDEFQRSMGLKWGGYTKPGDYTQNYRLFDPSFLSDYGLPPDADWNPVNLTTEDGNPSTIQLGTMFQKVFGNTMYTLDAKLELGESQGQVQTISSPRVVTLNNQLAEIIQGTKIATKNESESGGTTTQYVDATLKLAVTPQITPDNKLILELDISDDSPVSDGEDIETRSIQTKLFVDNEQTVVIGGVQQVNKSNTRDTVPGLSRIPLLGWLFKSKYTLHTKRELLIFIRPHIIES
ncbi:MAG: type IV pilus secretin PilQ [Thermodesulfobacteriota bacterium]